MENEQQNKKKARQRKFLLMLPVIAIPFITLIFWAMGGGQVQQADASTKKTKGFNASLPGANLKDDTGLDKMSYYDRAAKDSSERNSLLKNDPYYRQLNTDAAAATSFGSPYYPGSGGGLNSDPYLGSGGRDPNEAKIYQKLEELNMALQSQAPNQAYAGTSSQGYGQPGSSPEDMARLQKMMEAMSSKETEPDPEMEQLSGMLDKIIDIQNPGRQQEQLRKLSEEKKGRVYAVTAAKKNQRISLLEEPSVPPAKDSLAQRADQSSGFYSLDDQQADDNDQNAVDAVIAETQTIVSGSTVKLRLLDDIFINGKLIPKDQFIFGTAALSGERLIIKVPAVRHKKSVYPVDLSVIDIDGIEGIYIPGAIARDVAKQSSDRAIQELSFGTSMSSSIGIQAAGAGMEAAKSFFSKKVKLIKVTVKAGYKILLRDEKQKQDNNQ